MNNVQYIEENALSPQCLMGQHPDCKGRLSYMPDDGNGRTMNCPCTCHERAPKRIPASAEGTLYVITWEYEHKQPAEGENPEMSAWLKRSVITMDRELAEEWMDAIATLTETNAVRSLVVRRAKISEWETVGE